MNKSQRIAYGIGTAWFKKQPGAIDESLVDGIKTAVRVGYRHIDCAQVYGNETECGIALSSLPASFNKSQLFITTKYLPSKDKTALEALKESLEKLQLKKVDLYLVHHPLAGKDLPTLEEVWASMESCLTQGLASHVGVSNYLIHELERTAKVATLPIYANQIECHPYHAQTDVLEYCRANNILVESYCPLAPIVHKTDGPLAEPLESMSKKYGKSTGQILLRWNQQKGNIVVTTSRKEGRMRELLEIESFDLDPEDVATIDKLGSSISYKKYAR